MKTLKFLSQLLRKSRWVGHEHVRVPFSFQSRMADLLTHSVSRDAESHFSLKNGQLSFFHFNGTITKAHHGARTITAHYLSTM